MNKIVIVPLTSFEPKRAEFVVYRMWLDEYFYIGSTVNFSDRIRKHLVGFIRGKHYKVLSDKYKSCREIKFEVIGTASDNASLRKIEREFILKEVSNEYLLNSHGTTKAIIGFSSTKKLVKKTNKDGSFVIFDSILAAANDAGLERNNFRRNMVFGYKIAAGDYMEVDSQGNRVGHLRKPALHPEGYIYKRGPHQPVIDLKTGIFWTLKEVVFLTGIHDKKLRCLLADPKAPISTQYQYA